VGPLTGGNRGGAQIVRGALCLSGGDAGIGIKAQVDIRDNCSETEPGGTKKDYGGNRIQKKSGRRISPYRILPRIRRGRLQEVK